MKKVVLALLLCVSVASLNAKEYSNSEDSRICHEIAWHYALAMQDEFSMTGAEMELTYEDAYTDCENWE